MVFLCIQVTGNRCYWQIFVLSLVGEVQDTVAQAASYVSRSEKNIICKIV